MPDHPGTAAVSVIGETTSPDIGVIPAKAESGTKAQVRAKEMSALEALVMFPIAGY
jgi:hypothetical protein